jgi:hypothetical protein
MITRICWNDLVDAQWEFFSRTLHDESDEDEGWDTIIVNVGTDKDGFPVSRILRVEDIDEEKRAACGTVSERDPEIGLRGCPWSAALEREADPKGYSRATLVVIPIAA